MAEKLSTVEWAANSYAIIQSIAESYKKNAGDDPRLLMLSIILEANLAAAPDEVKAEAVESVRKAADQIKNDPAARSIVESFGGDPDEISKDIGLG